MIDAPQIAHTKVQPSAVIRLAIAQADMPKYIGPALRELLALVKEQGIGPASPWYIYVHALAEGKIDCEVGVPVTDPVKPSGRARSGSLPGTKIARTIYHGSYQGLPGAWSELDAWVAENGHKPAGPLWDVYLAGPETGSDTSKWRTQLNRPLLG